MRSSVTIFISLLITTSIACASGGSTSSSDEMAETLMADSANADATGAALRPTYEAGLTQDALPTATMTPIGPVFDGGDGLETTFIYNVANTAGTSGGSGGQRHIGLGQAHNYLLNFQPGAYHIGVIANEADPRFVLFDPTGEILAEVDNTEGELKAAIWVSIGEAGIYNLRISANVPGLYTFNLNEGNVYADNVFTGGDNRITTDITQLNFGTLTGGADIWVADSSEAINLMIRSDGTEGNIIFRAEGQGAAIPILIVIDPEGNIVGSDANTDGDNMAEVSASLTLVGKYTVRVSVQQPTTENDKFVVTAERQ